MERDAKLPGDRLWCLRGLGIRTRAPVHTRRHRRTKPATNNTVSDRQKRDSCLLARQAGCRIGKQFVDDTPSGVYRIARWRRSCRDGASAVRCTLRPRFVFLGLRALMIEASNVVLICAA